jgi:uncharacterized protein with beta-barrel porin domain
MIASAAGIAGSARIRWLSGTIISGLTFLASPALADCTPDPSLPNTTTTCTGLDADGLTVSTAGTVIVVAPGATVLPRSDKAGAIVVSSPTGLTVTLSNSGTISSSDGAAVRLQGFASFRSITNASGALISGTIAGIIAPDEVYLADRLDNAGTIEAGNGNALSGSFGAIFNTGTIRSNGTAATLRMPYGGPSLFANSGSIVNLGTGAAIDAGTGSLNLSNQAGGVVGSAGTVAIRAGGGLSLLNAGTINGSVIGGSSSDKVDTRAGLINGDVLLGDGNDHLIAALGSGGLASGINGVVDGGDGTDFLELIIAQNRTLINPAMPTGFERLQLNLEKDAVLTLGGNVVPAGGYSVRGIGTLMIGTDMTTTGPTIIRQIAQQNLGFEKLSFVNDKVVTATLDQSFLAAVSLEQLQSVVNSGTIRGIGGVGANMALNQDVRMLNTGLIEGTSAGLIVSGALQNDGVIRSTDGIGLSNDLGGGVVRGKTSTNQGLIEGRTAGVSLGSMFFVNNGTIRATDGVGALAGSYSTLHNKAGGTISGTTAAVSGGYNAILINEGAIAGNVDFTAAFSSPDIVIDRGGTITGNVLLGDGNDLYIADIARGVSGVTGTIDAGSGTDTLRLLAGANASATIVTPPTFEKMGYEVQNGATLKLSATAPLSNGLELTGVGRIEISADFAPQKDQVLDLIALPTAKLLDPLAIVSGTLRVISKGTMTLDGTTPGAPFAAVYARIFANGDNRTIAFENDGTINAIAPAGSMAFPFAIRGGAEIVNNGTINLQSAYGVYEAKSFINKGVITEAVGNGSVAIGTFSTPSVVNSGKIQVNGVAVWFGGGFDPALSGANLDNSGTIESRTQIGVRGTAYNQPALIQNAASGLIRGLDIAISLDGSTQLTNAGTIEGSVILSTDFGSGSSMIDNSGAIKGALRLGSGFDRLTNSGSITGAIDLAAGNDMLVIRSGATFGSTVSGGAGVDVIRFDTVGTSAAPSLVDLTSFSAFERLENAGGTAAITSSFAVGQIDVLGGRLIGSAGTTLTGNVAVSAGATFGSAGTVVGNVTVATGGTLAPGASPGVMTVNGNLSLASGTTTAFELAAAGQSDQIVINGGSLTIASGAILDISGTALPGTLLDLIIVNGGTINGTFTTVNFDSRVGGQLTYAGGKLSILRTFAVPAGVDVQAGSAIAYVNNLLISGQATSALRAAVPSLLAGGTTNVAAFARLTPEPYATASQLGVEQGLSLSRSLRTTGIGGGADGGFYGFAEAIGNWRDWNGASTTGVSGARSRSFGALAGIGHGNEQVSLGAFVGHVDSRQTISALGGRTDADGAIAGAMAQYRSGAFLLTASLAYDWSAADTERTAPGGASVRSHYDLHSLVLDASAAYAVAVGSDWALRPEAGITHISTRRDAAAENGSAAFALAVDAAHTKATFIDGSLYLEREQGRGDGLRPWVRAGLRQQLDGQDVSATAGFAGTPLRMTVAGVTRGRTAASGGLGASIDLTPRLNLGGAYQVEVSDGTSHNASLRLRLTL